MTFWKWSKTAANNATADSTCPFPEGMAASAYNDGMRGAMAAAAKWRDDITGLNLAGLSGSAYVVTSNQGITSNLDGFTVQFLAQITNTGAVTLSVDGQTAQPLRFFTGLELPSGVLISGSLYQATYRQASGEWLLHSFNASVYAIPVGGVLEYYGAAAPNGAFVLPIGQAISRTAFASLFSLFGTAYGAGDGATTFNIPDLTGRVAAMREGAASLLTATYFGGNSTVIGTKAGSENHLLTTAEIPAHVHPNTLNDLSHTHPWGPAGFQASIAATGAAGTTPQYGTISTNTGGNNTAPMSISNANNTGGGGAHAIVQPTIICNKIMRVI